MTTFNFKRFLVGATAAAALAAPSIAMADPTCVYVMGVVNSVTVATPAVIIPVPDSEVDVQPVRVHVDATEQNIIGYSVRTPGVDEGADPDRVFVPGTEVTINPIVYTSPELPLEAHRCVNQTVSTPAIPVYVPGSIITTPGASVNVPAIELNILGRPATTPGKVIILEDATIVIPDFTAYVPSVSATTPNETIVVHFGTNGLVEQAKHLPPTAP